MVSLVIARSTILLLFAITLAGLDPLAGASAREETVLYAFKGGSDGAGPSAGLIMDATGNLYGTTEGGGQRYKRGAAYGTVFKLTSDGTESVLYAFQSLRHGDGEAPLASLIADNSNDLYGTTVDGGIKCHHRHTAGCGTVFKISADGEETVLHAFAGKKDGSAPESGLVSDRDANLFGTTYEGGNTGCELGYGCGTVFMITPEDRETVVHAFTGGSDGAHPSAGLLLDKSGNLYGVTSQGGIGAGTVFRVSADGSESVLYAFQGGTDGKTPEGTLITDKRGNLYGVTANGGTSGFGTVFKLAPNGVETVLYSFGGGSDGEGPSGNLVLDSSGNLYGTTSAGGNGGCITKVGCGTVFKVTPDGTESLLHIFTGLGDGGIPYSGLIENTGELYGTTSYGGSKSCGSYGCGTVFKIKH